MITWKGIYVLWPFYEIFVNENSILGSIGVISAGFGFSEAIKKLGIERRIHTSGTKKSLLDPFIPEQIEDVERLKQLQSEIHNNFKNLVRQRRGQRLRLDDSELFSGDFWLGENSVKIGLADGIGEIRAILRERYGKKVIIRYIGRRPGWIRRRVGFTEIGQYSSMKDGENIVENIFAAIESRAWWSRFGM